MGYQFVSVRTRMARGSPSNRQSAAFVAGSNPIITPLMEAATKTRIWVPASLPHPLNQLLCLLETCHCYHFPHCTELNPPGFIQHRLHDVNKQ